MTTDEIIAMARDAGAETQDGKHWEFDDFDPIRFAALVAAAEREACAKVSEDDEHEVDGRGYYDQLGDSRGTARNISTAIRARSQQTGAAS